MAAFLVSTNLNAFPDRSDGAQTEFDGIEEVALILGGSVGKRFSFFGDIDLFEEGEPGEIGRLYVQWNRSLLFNLRVGLFEPRAVPLSNHRRLIRSTGYLANTMPIVAAQNFFGFSPSQKGIEVFGRLAGFAGKGEFEWAAGVVNGEHGGAFDALAETPALEDLIRNLDQAYGARGEFDFNDQKDVYGSLDYEVWLAGTFTFGGFFYRGTTGFLMDPEDPDSFVDDGNSFRRYGTRFRWEEKQGKFVILAVASMAEDRLDRNLLNRLDTRFYVGDVEWLPFPWLIAGLRMEQVDPEETAPMTGDRFERYTFELVLLPAANVKLALGVTDSSDDAPNLPPFAKRYRAGLTIAF